MQPAPRQPDGRQLFRQFLLSVQVAASDRAWPTNLQYARLNGMDLRCRTADGVILRFADMTGAKVNMALMKGSDTSGAKMPTTRTHAAVSATVSPPYPADAGLPDRASCDRTDGP